MSPRFIPLVLLCAAPCILFSTAILPAADPPAQAAAAIPTMPAQSPVMPAPNPRATNPYSAEAGVVRTGIANSPAEQAIRQTLMHPATFDFTNTPLKDVIDFIADRHHLPVQLDIKAMKEDSQPLDPSKALVTFSAREIPLRTALNKILSDLGLTYVIGDDVLLITTPDKASSILQTRLYDVHDLVLRDTDPMGSADFDSLVDAIRQTVNPQTWDKNGGPCSIAPYASNGLCTLIVVQSFDGQEQIDGLLSELRKMKPQRYLRQ